jgi:hypothetical protein
MGGCWLIITDDDGDEVQPAAFETVKVYVPPSRPGIMVVVLFPVVLTEPGLRVMIHEPDGNPDRATEPVEEVHVGCVTVPVMGAEGTEFTVRENVTIAGLHGSPAGLFVVKVIVTTLPRSPAAGV